MKFFFLFLGGCIFLQLFFVHATDLNKYLHEKLRQSKIELIKSHIQETSPVQERSYNVHWNRLWRQHLASEHQPFTINMFNGTFILDGNRVMAPSFNETPLNETYQALREVGQIAEYSTIKFVRSIVWKDTTYLLVCYELDSCSFYTITQNGILRFRHTIGRTGISVDAIFFAQDDQLYLVVVNNANKFSMPSVIYRWSGTYMDNVGEVMTIGAISVTAFEHRRSTIIVFARSDTNEIPRISSEVYEFKDSNIARIQFLFTAQPTSVHHYIHSDFNFVLVINELGPSSVLCWDGRELLNWISLPEINPHSLINIFNIDGDTFVIVAHDNIIQLYKSHSTFDWKSENIKHLQDDQKVVDMAILMNGHAIILMVVIQEKDVYWVEQWEITITWVSSDGAMQDADVTRKSLSDVIQVLQARMPAIMEAEASWKHFLPFAKNLTILEPMTFDSLILQSGQVENIEITMEGDVLPPHQIEKALDELEREIHNIETAELSRKEINVTEDMLKTIQDKIVFDDVYVEELEIDRVNVDSVNDVDLRYVNDMQSEKIVLQEDGQIPHQMRVKNLIVQNLEVDSLCGIPFQYWTLKNQEGIALAIANSTLEYSNDTIMVHSDLTVPKLNITSLNETIVDELINNLFIINRSQKIKGTLRYKNFLQVTNLTTQMLNGVPVDQLMTTTTDQSFEDFYIKNLKIKHLQADTIKGVPIEEAARKSRKNVIKGKLILANLHVTEDLAIDVNASIMKIPQERPLQIYENVTILGDLYIHNIKVDKTATLFVKDIPVNVSDMFDSFWTKSTDQTIIEETTFERGLTIDKLNTKYLNGFEESDFLYTTMEEIPNEFTNLYFENFHVDEFLSESNNLSLFQVQPQKLIIQKEVYLQSLKTNDIITLAFNGIDVDGIMNGTRINISRLADFPIVRANRVIVDKLDIGLLNNREIFFEDGLHIDDDHQLSILKIPEFHVQNLKVERLNGIDMNSFTQLKDLMQPDVNGIVIDGDLIVEDLKLAQVDKEPIESFLEKLAKHNITIMSEKSIESLVVRNITLESLHGQNVNNFFASVLSKSREQTIPGHFSAHIITSDNITVNFINEHNTSELIWVNKPITINGDVTFTDLVVEGDVITSKMNDRNVNELYESLLYVPAKNIQLLKVAEDLNWKTPLSSPTSISYLLNNAVTNDTNQIITGNVTFAKSVHAWAVTGLFNEVNQIQNIISDVVTDCEERIEISGKKFFEENLIVDNLTVNGDVSIAKVNDVNILEFNDSVVRKNCEDTIAGSLTFLKEVTVERLRVSNADLNASINAAVRIGDVMPNNIFFENLVVLHDVHLENLNGINFDEFARNRITLNGNHYIPCDVKFNGIVTVTGNANIGKINKIRPSEFVLNNINKAQIITGVKTFKENLIVDGDVTAPLVNNINIINEYKNSVQNGEDVEITGNLIFKGNVRIQNMTVSGLVNNINVHFSANDFKKKVNETLEMLNENWRIIDKNIEYSTQISKTLPSFFFYLEVEEYLSIPGINVSKVDVVYYNNSTRLNMYSELPGSFCSLPDECPCVYQSIVDLTNNEVRRQRENFGKVIKNFHSSNGSFGIDVISNVVSNSKKCISTRTEEEFTRIVWMESKESEEIFTDISEKIGGYLKDAKMFKHDDDTYIVLAIYYDKAHATHRTSSLLYKMDDAMRNATLIQKLPTNGAWSLQIFKIDHEVFLLIGCFAEFSQSVLYRFDPITQKFGEITTFASRSRYVKSLSQGKDHFVLLDDPDMHVINIYKYDSTSRNFYNYQNIFHVHPINGFECFYTADIDNSDVFVIVTTEGGRFYIYEYMFAGKFQMRMQFTVDGLRMMKPFYHMNRHYIFAGTYGSNTLFRIVKQGP